MTKSSMVSLNIHEAKTHLSRYLTKVEEGQSILLCRNGKPVAQINPLPPPKKGSRRSLFGMGKGMGKVTPAFFEPLTDEDFPGIGL